MSRRLRVIVPAVLLAFTIAACEEEPSSGGAQSETSQSQAPAAAPAGEDETGTDR